MTTDELVIFFVPFAAGIPSSMVGQWAAAFAGLAILVLLRPRTGLVARHARGQP